MARVGVVRVVYTSHSRNISLELAVYSSTSVSDDTGNILLGKSAGHVVAIDHVLPVTARRSGTALLEDYVQRQKQVVRGIVAWTMRHKHGTNNRDGTTREGSTSVEEYQQEVGAETGGAEEDGDIEVGLQTLKKVFFF